MIPRVKQERLCLSNIFLGDSVVTIIEWLQKILFYFLYVNFRLKERVVLVAMSIEYLIFSSSLKLRSTFEIALFKLEHRSFGVRATKLKQ